MQWKVWKICLFRNLWQKGVLTELSEDFLKLKTILKSFLSYTNNGEISPEDMEDTSPRTPKMSVPKMSLPAVVPMKLVLFTVDGVAKRLSNPRRLLLFPTVGLELKSNPPSKSRRLFAFAISDFTVDSWMPSDDVVSKREIPESVFCGELKSPNRLSALPFEMETSWEVVWSKRQLFFQKTEQL